MCCVELPARPRDTWPAQIVDVKRAIAWVKEHIGKHGGDPDFVVVTGGSAGGHLGAHPTHPAGDRPLSCGGALPRRECGHAQRVVPGGLVRRGAAGPPARGIRPEARPTVRRPVRQRTFRPDPYARLFGERKQHEAQHVVCPMPCVDQFEMGNQRRRRSPQHRVFRRARSPPGSQRRTHGDNPDHRLPRPRAPNDPPWGPQASLNSRALVLPWRRTLSGCEYLAAWP
ncbi:alpha/beta hydrolase [Candidatus Microthrix parvicella]|uniref:alpha/beta hydrolase fold domain-containing protein n=1 Tax=Candidatus Neomicrothrix parvicella TaxID=41950 RepID=UPI001930A220